jgi:hypothetical protein
MGKEKGNQIPKPQTSGRNPIPRNKTSVISRSNDSKWRFSFSYWRQHKHFGLSCEKVDANWFVSLLERLRALSDITIENVSTSNSDAWRFHKIDWRSRGIQTTKEEIDWIPKQYLREEEFGFFQFNISKAFGRVVGFFDEDYMFHVVFLDPMHNMQPSNYSDYEVRYTQKLLTPYEEKHQKFLSLKSHIDNCSEETCEVKTKTQDITYQDSGLYIFLEEMFFEDIKTLHTKAKYIYIQDILIDAIDLLLVKYELKN